MGVRERDARDGRGGGETRRAASVCVNVVLESSHYILTRPSRFVAFVYGGVETGRWPRRSFAS